MDQLMCPCPSPWEYQDHSTFIIENYQLDNTESLLGVHFYRRRRLADSDEGGETWEMIYVGFVLLFMFVALLSDKIGADMVMLAALTACMVPEIISVSEGVSGFSNEGVLTVLVLFVVASGIQLTGGLDWYMSKLLGRPHSVAAAQLRLMGPIAFISAFLNNTPVVVVMIPIVQKWGKNVGFSPAQLLVPLSFASILGGTCTLIGTSTNLVVSGLLNERYSGDDRFNIGLFDLGEFGIPIATVGMSYILLASPYLLPGGKKGRKDEGQLPVDDGTLLLGARLTKWSPAVGRSVKRSGLRDTGGIYLVSVYRAATGNIHRAVGQEFVLNVEDILYFTGLVEGFGQFCEKHGLEVVTNEVDIGRRTEMNLADKNSIGSPENNVDGGKQKVVRFSSMVETTIDDNDKFPSMIDTSRNSPRNSSKSPEAEKLRAINRMRDMIRGYNPSEPSGEEISSLPAESASEDPAKVVVVSDTQDLQDMVIVGINAVDRPGLLLDISRGLHALKLQLHHTEASVIHDRSISIWRCEVMNDDAQFDAGKIASVMNELLEKEGGVEAVKRRGLSVIRAVVTDHSRLGGKSLPEVQFRDTYRAAIIAVQKSDKSKVKDLTQVIFSPGDILVLQANDDSPLLVRPPSDFYVQSDKHTGYKFFFKAVAHKFSSSDLKEKDKHSCDALSDGGHSLFKAVSEKLSSSNLTGATPENSGVASSSLQNSDYRPDVETGADGAFFIPDSDSENDEQSQTNPLGADLKAVAEDNEALCDAWGDLRVLFHRNSDDKTTDQMIGNASREYLAAMIVSPKSPHVKKTVSQAGLDKLTGLFLVQAERPFPERSSTRITLNSPNKKSSIVFYNGSETGSASGTLPSSSIPVLPDEQLQEGDILWFAGPAAAIADLRKIPGLVSFEDDELKQINEKVHDRRLVQAVVARKGPLVGKTAAEVGFRTRYGAAVIAVHRDGTRVQDHPGNIKLQAGDVLLLEAGPTFISRNTDNQQSFALISEVKDSKPPRLNKLIPAIVLVVAMLAVVTAGLASLLVCGLVTSMIMISTGILSQQEARDAINWDVYVTIACAFGIGIALTNSGLANSIAEGLVTLGDSLGIGPAGLYGAVYLGTVLISNVVTNNAAAALMFPIAMEAADQTGADPLLMAYNLMLAASASFMSPFGYTTNLLIYGPGGYKVKDFLYIGTPMQIILWVLTTAILTNTKSKWFMSWIVTFAIFVAVLLALIFPAFIKNIFSRMTGSTQQDPGITEPAPVTRK